MTTYAEVTADDRDVAVYLAAQLHVLNIWRLPRAAWVARDNDEIIAVLVLTNVDYPALHLFLPHPETRPFIRILRLWELAKTWLRAHAIPVVAAPVFAHLRHFQSLLRRVGFRLVGQETDAAGNVIEVVYAYTLKGTSNENPLRPTE